MTCSTAVSLFSFFSLCLNKTCVLKKSACKSGFTRPIKGGMKFTALLLNINATMHTFHAQNLPPPPPPLMATKTIGFLHWTKRIFSSFHGLPILPLINSARCCPVFSFFCFFVFCSLRECVCVRGGGVHEGAVMLLWMFLSAHWRSCRPVASSGVTLAGRNVSGIRAATLHSIDSRAEIRPPHRD